MCLIIASQTGRLPTRNEMRLARLDNPDGYGLMWHEAGRVQVLKGFNHRTLAKALRKIAGRPYVLHYRLATHGAVTLANAHPFKVAPGLFMAHNGVMPDAREGHSDSRDYAVRLAARLRGNGRKLGEHLPAIEAEIGPYNKLAFLRADGELLIANRERGLDIDGKWFSNEYSLPMSTWRSVTFSGVEAGCSGCGRVSVLEWHPLLEEYLCPGCMSAAADFFEPTKEMNYDRQ